MVVGKADGASSDVEMTENKGPEQSSVENGEIQPLLWRNSRLNSISPMSGPIRWILTKSWAT